MTKVPTRPDITGGVASASVCGRNLRAFEPLTLRTELSLVLSTLLVVSIGLAGGTAIYQSARTMRRELTTEHQLFAENRAFALRDNFQILEEELKRLALLPEMLTNDADLRAQEKILFGAHENSVLYNTAVLLLSPEGVCVRSVSDRSDFRGRAFGDREWFLAARGGSSGPLFRASDEPGLGRTLKIVQPRGARRAVRRRAGRRHRAGRGQPHRARAAREPAARHGRGAGRRDRRGHLPDRSRARGRRVRAGRPRSPPPRAAPAAR